MHTRLTALADAWEQRAGELMAGSRKYERRSSAARSCRAEAHALLTTATELRAALAGTTALGERAGA